MRLICPNCDAQYEVADSAIPEDGRDVQCSNCGQTWFQKSAYMLEMEIIESAKAEVSQSNQHDPSQAPTETIPTTPAPETEKVTEISAPPEETTVSQPTVAPPHRKPSDAALEILREEAEIAAKARPIAAESSLETQPELGLESTIEAPARIEHVVQERRANLQDNAPQEPHQRSRRDLLPDIEEINSTLRATSDRNDETLQDHDSIAYERSQKRRGFRLGFGLVLLLTAGLIGVYVFAPQISGKIPQAEAFLSSYTDGVNDLRNWLETVMEKATDKMTTNQ